ncbi:GAF domain-containing protein [Xylophilus sp.]|uniref:GAF domain-containing protein n=1 Tax=Xylophilus sp. TaxID=2653893 RepID=UPI0013BCF946|nr:GAF domain-containing protein [Xylophilus sp.]KAF1049537.1 MAG: Bacteriophytochrome [Xylophilus sp.]
MTAIPSPGPGGADAVTLENCDREPIHIPGAIQPHGALLAFDGEGILTHRSENAAELLGDALPVLGERLSPAHFGGHARIHAALADGLALAGQGGGEAVPLVSEVHHQGRTLELIVHTHAGAVIAEFETWPEGADDLAAFAFKAHRGMDRLRRLRTVDALLAAAVEEVRQLTGFDRVMAYRFRHGDSGDVVAESRIDALEPFLNRRYPASDIPAQARRLYIANTLRLIGDVEAVPVAVLAAPDRAAPLDMSYSVLRSVSPVHIEYLTNMGVGASMSVSIVVNGRLWGMLACHHMTPRRVHYSVRMACDVLAQFLAANIRAVTDRERARRLDEAAALRSRLVGRVLHADDVLGAMSAAAQEIQDLFQAHALLLSDDGRQAVHGPVDATVARSLLQWLNREVAPTQDRLIQAHTLDLLPPALRSQLGSWCGLMALRFDQAGESWMVLLRREQIETIQWGGRPEKVYVSGPRGPRLTPRGSFDAWKETVRDAAVPWSETEVEIAHRFLDELLRATAARTAEIARARSHLFAILSQNLSDPLQSLAQAASVLDDGGSVGDAAISERIQASSSRMQRLVAQVLDISRLQNGGGLALQPREADWSAVVNDVVKEAQAAFPGTRFIREIPREFGAVVDVDRIRQVVSSLVQNAGRHGAADEPVLVQLYERDGHAVLDVSNVGEPIAAELEPLLFDPVRRQSVLSNQRGMGLGLYIAHAVVEGHGGSLQYNYAEPYIVFSVSLPRGDRAPVDVSGRPAEVG